MSKGNRTKKLIRKLKHGGSRKGAGRKPLPDNLKKKVRYLSDEEFLKLSK
jgi:hypothetical protein